jgi:hypothetical protein
MAGRQWQYEVVAVESFQTGFPGNSAGGKSNDDANDAMQDGSTSGIEQMLLMRAKDEILSLKIFGI